MATDAEFLSAATASGISSQASAGSTLANVTTDLSFLAGAVGTGQRSRLYIVTTPTLCKKLAFKSDTVGARAFPELGPLGGQIANIPVLISDAVTSGDVLLVDASGFVANSDLITLDQSRQATIELSTTPDSPATASTTTVSLWQHNMSAVRAERWWGVQRMRNDAVARITGAAY